MPTRRRWSILFAGPAFLLVAYVLALALPLALVLLAQPFHFSLPLAPLYAICLYAAWRLARIAGAGEPRIVALTFWIFVYVFLGAFPLLQAGTRVFPWPQKHDDAILIEAALVALAGMASFDLGQFVLSRRLRALAVPGALRRPLSKAAIVLVALASFACAAILLYRLGGLETLLLPRLERAEYLADRFSGPEATLLTHFARTPVYVALVAALVMMLRARARSGAGWKMLALFLLLATAVMNNPVATPRFTVGTIVLSLFFVLPWRRWHGAAAALGLVAGLMFVFPLTDLFRNSLEARFSEKAQQAGSLRQLAERGDFDAFQQLANAVVVARKDGLRMGAQAGGALLFWVPRAAWKDKPQATGEFIADRVGYEFSNLSAPLWAELYIDGGYLLVVLGFMAYGAAVRTFDEWRARGGPDAGPAAAPQMLTLLVPVYAGYQLYLLRGSLMPALAYFVPILLFAFLCTRSSTWRYLSRGLRAAPSRA